MSSEFVLDGESCLRFKYVVFESGHTECVAIFDKIQGHRDYKHCGKIISAGFVDFGACVNTKTQVVCCHGKSVSLDVESRGKVDVELIKQRARDY